MIATVPMPPSTIHSIALSTTNYYQCARGLSIVGTRSAIGAEVVVEWSGSRVRRSASI